MGKMISGASLLLIVTLAFSCASASHYRVRHDSKSLYEVLSTKIANGDSLTAIEAILGPSQPTAGDAYERAMRAIQSFAADSPDRYPDGVHDSDVLVEYPMASCGAVILQIRDGRLVNHIPADFADGPAFSALAPASDYR